MLPKLGRGLLGAEVAALLETRILDGEWKPGECLPPQDRLCEQLGVSRTVIRDAMRTLAARGLVEITQGVGTIVAHKVEGAYSDAIFLSLLRAGVTVGEVAEAREVIERTVASVAAAHRTYEDCEKMQSRLDRLSDAVARQDWQSALSAHLAFHLSILDATHMEVLQILLRPMQRIIAASSLPPDIDDAQYYDLSAERELLEAIRAQDERAVERALRHHFEFIRDRRYAHMFARPFRDASRIAGFGPAEIAHNDGQTFGRQPDRSEQPA